MSIQRFIHPSIWRSEQFASLCHGEQLLFIGCFSTADDEGRRKASPASIKADVFPLDDSVRQADIAVWTRHVHDMGMIRVYSGPDKVQFLDLPTWSTYQKPKYKKKSILPAFSPDLPPIWPISSPDMDQTCAESGQGLGRDGLGCIGLGREGVATAAEAVAGERFTIPKPMVEHGQRFGAGFLACLGKALKSGWDAETLLAWVLVLVDAKPEKPIAYMRALTKSGKQPPAENIARARKLLAARDAEIAGGPLPSFASCLKSADTGRHGPGINAARNAALDATEGER